MVEFIRLCSGFLSAIFKSRAALQTENLALRHQLCVCQRTVKRPKVRPADRWRMDNQERQPLTRRNPLGALR